MHSPGSLFFCSVWFIYILNKGTRGIWTNQETLSCQSTVSFINFITVTSPSYGPVQCACLALIIMLFCYGVFIMACNWHCASCIIHNGRSLHSTGCLCHAAARICQAHASLDLTPIDGRRALYPANANSHRHD